MRRSALRGAHRRHARATLHLVMRLTVPPLVALLALLPAIPAAAQQLTEPERIRAVAEARAFAACVRTRTQAVLELERLFDEAEEQRRRAPDAAARQDAVHTLEALVLQAAELQAALRACFETELTPEVAREAQPDAAEASVARDSHSLVVVEEGTRLGRDVTVVRAEQVDGQGRLDAGLVRSAMRGIQGAVQRCYEPRRSAARGRDVHMVFTVDTRGRVRGAEVEHSEVPDPTLTTCLERALDGLRVAATPRGGDATYSYVLRGR